jgi:hypothetical protein
VSAASPIFPGDVIVAHKSSSQHRKQIEESPLCGCFHCLSTFAPNEIIEWVDEDKDGIGQTAMCPKCAIDSVIGSKSDFPLSRDFLARMRLHWFGE